MLGSRSTYLRAGFGGLHGRALQTGDALPVGRPGTVGQQLARQLGEGAAAGWAQARWMPGPELRPKPARRPIVRAIQGLEFDSFSIQSQQDFWQQPLTVTTEADRMGFRLQGPLLERAITNELLSTAVAFGTVQVPAGGQAIVLLADHQTTGGYPRIAQVITADFSVLAQLAPGQSFRFAEVSLAEAQALYLAQEQQLRALRRGIELRVLT
nr:hypothetical protein [Hymenobacter glacialis]